MVQNAPCLSRFNISARPISDAQPSTVVEPIVTIGTSVECVEQLSTCAVTCQLSSVYACTCVGFMRVGSSHWFRNKRAVNLLKAPYFFTCERQVSRAAPCASRFLDHSDFKSLLFDDLANKHPYLRFQFAFWYIGFSLDLHTECFKYKDFSILVQFETMYPLHVDSVLWNQMTALFTCTGTY